MRIHRNLKITFGFTINDDQQHMSFDGELYQTFLRAITWNPTAEVDRS